MEFLVRAFTEWVESNPPPPSSEGERVRGQGRLGHHGLFHSQDKAGYINKARGTKGLNACSTFSLTKKR